MKNILKDIAVDKNIFRKTFIYSLLFFPSVFIIGEIFTRLFQAVGAKLPGAQNNISPEQLASQAGSSNQILYLYLFLVFLFFAVQLYNYSFFENLNWNTIFGKKTTLNNTNKFLVLTISLGAILTSAVLLIFLVISKLPDSLTKAGVIFFFLSILFAFYFLYIGYISFGRTHEIIRSIKNAFIIGVKRLNMTIIPMVIAAIIGLLINGLLLLLSWLPGVALSIVEAITLAAYIAWFRIYLADSLKSVKL